MHVKLRPFFQIADEALHAILHGGPSYMKQACARTCRYEVTKKRPKFDDAITEMAERIGRNFMLHRRVACGIVYCLSRNDCEKVASELQVRLQHGHSARVMRSSPAAFLTSRACMKVSAHSMTQPCSASPQKKLVEKVSNRVRVRYGSQAPQIYTHLLPTHTFLPG